MTIPTPAKPHVSKAAGGVAGIMTSNETMMISSGDGRLWVQNGAIYDEAGKELAHDDIPGWFWDEYNKITPGQKAEHGTLADMKDKTQAHDQSTGIVDHEANQPGPNVAKVAGDLSNKGGDPVAKEPHQMSPEERAANDLQATKDVQGGKTDEERETAFQKAIREDRERRSKEDKAKARADNDEALAKDSDELRKDQDKKNAEKETSGGDAGKDKAPAKSKK